MAILLAFMELAFHESIVSVRLFMSNQPDVGTAAMAPFIFHLETPGLLAIYIFWYFPNHLTALDAQLAGHLPEWNTSNNSYPTSNEMSKKRFYLCTNI
ncbi:hypothetical protein F4679DRAFT_589936 [Xylaria curta]|nr:hypothetical protein F4679DRAFT_589936 [Xylaria curta]